jgi:hypothetical protein
MIEVTILPMPDRYRKIPARLRPGVPPVFSGCPEGGPTPEDIELARALFGALDAESQDWYRSNCPSLFAGL